MYSYIINNSNNLIIDIKNVGLTTAATTTISTAELKSQLVLKPDESHTNSDFAKQANS
jgi:hypothetical protein